MVKHEQSYLLISLLK